MRLFEWFSKQILYSAVESSFEVFWDVESLILCSCALATQVFFSWWALTLFIRTENGATDPYQNKTENLRRPCGTLFYGRAFLHFFRSDIWTARKESPAVLIKWSSMTLFYSFFRTSFVVLSLSILWIKGPFLTVAKKLLLSARHQKCRRPDKEKTSKS